MLAASTMAGEAVGPVVTVAGEQPHARAVAVDDQAVAVVFYFMETFRPGWNFDSAGWETFVRPVQTHACRDFRARPWK